MTGERTGGTNTPMSVEKISPRPGASTPAVFELSPEQSTDQGEIEDLLDKALGPERKTKPAHIFREGLRPIAELCMVARTGGAMTGMIRYSPVWIGEAKTPGLLLGPLAVDPSLRGVGIGIELMTRTLDTAKQLGHRIVVLVGDEPYYGRVGFSRSAAHKLVLPGQNDQARLLALELTKDALTDASGILTPASDFSRFSNN